MVEKNDDAKIKLLLNSLQLKYFLFLSNACFILIYLILSSLLLPIQFHSFKFDRLIDMQNIFWN